LSLLTDNTGSGLSKRLGSLSLRDLRGQGFQPMAISSLLAKIGTSDSIDIFKDMKQIVKSFDISKFGNSKPKFDKTELSALNSKFFQLVDYTDISHQLNILDLKITNEFWNLIRGNINNLDDVKFWWNIVYGDIKEVSNDQDFKKLALQTLPKDRFDKNTWSVWTNSLMKESGKKGKELFKPLRLCLTGQNNGPEMANLVLMMGKDKIKERLNLIEQGEQIKEILNEKITQDNQITEYMLANLVPKLWPAENPIMLSASSPIRDWLTFSENGTLTRNCFSFRGASGIDGTLSLALGISRIKNPLLLVTGDLAFIHDINGWLIENSIDMNLTILLINNNGGNIFNRIYKENLKDDELKKLFLMPKEINWPKLAEGYQVNFKSVANFKKLREALDWSISIQKSVIIKVDVDPENEICEKNAPARKNYWQLNLSFSIFE